MKSEFMLPIFAGNYCIAGKNAVLCRVSNKGAVGIQTSKLKYSLIPHKKILFLRGLEYIFFSCFYFFSALRKSFIYANERIVFKTKSPYHNKQLYFGGALAVVAIFIAIFLFGFLPTQIGFYLFSYNYSLFLKKFCIAIVKCILFYLAFWSLSLLPSIKMLWRFNTAGNIAITGNKHRPLNFFNVLLSALLLTFFVVCLLGINVEFGWKVLINLGIFLVAIAITFELAIIIEKKGGKWINLSSIVGLLTTAPVGKTELQVANGALSEGILMKENSERELIENNAEGGISFAFVLSEVKEELKKHNIVDFGEVEWLIASCLKCKKLDLKFLKNVTKNQQKDIMKAVEKRIKGEPIDKIFGFTEFFGMEIKVNKNVLTPRQETEILVESVIKEINNQNLSVLDLCTGSGAIAISVAKNTKAKVFASDISENALDIAKFNAKKHNAKILFKKSDMFSKLHLKKFDIIVSNPPYIPSNEVNNLDIEVKNYDPFIALDGGKDGLVFYKIIAKEANKYLTKNGKLFLEVGKGQALKVKKLLTENFTGIKITKDYNGVQRFLQAQKK